MREKVKKKLCWWQKLLVVIGCIVALVGAVLLGAIGYFKLSVRKYYKASEKAFVIPGLSDGFVPQGLHFDEESGNFFITGYRVNGGASPIYLVEKESGKTKKEVKLLNADGTAFTGHAGGIAVFGDFVYVAGGEKHCLFVYSYKEILTANNKAGVKALGRFETNVSKDDYVAPAFVTVYENYLILGEYHDIKHYPTPPSHKITTKSGDYNEALGLVYEFSSDEGSVYGLKTVPLAALSIPDCVQGMCFYEGKAYFSTSWGLRFSEIFVHGADKAERQADISLLGIQIPLYAFDLASYERTIKIAPMAEEIVFVDGKMYVMCESASDKYIFGKFISAKWCYKTDVDKC